MDKTLRAKRSKASGQMFEDMISGSCDWYEREMLAKIEKQEEALAPIRPMGQGRFLAAYKERAGVDYKGTLKGGRAVVFEAKHTDTEVMERKRVKDWQMSYLQTHHELGAVAFVLVSFGLERFYRIPFPVWLDMKTHIGKMSFREKDVERFRIKAVAGRIYFLEGLQDG